MHVDNITATRIATDPVMNFSMTDWNATNRTHDVILNDLNRKYATALLPFTVALGAFGVAGILGNILVFIIYGSSWQLRDKKIRVYILSLAVIDFVTSLSLIPAEIWKHRAYFNFEKTEVCKTKCFLNVFAASAASLCLLLIAFDRYILTCHPLLFVKLRSFSYATAWKLCLLIICFGFAIALPAAFFCGVAMEAITTEDGSRIVIHHCTSEPSYEESYVRYAYKLILCILQVLVCIVLTVIYAQIGRAVSKVIQIRKCGSGLTRAITETDLEEKDEKVCSTCHKVHSELPLKLKVLFVVTLVYIITHMFYVALSWVDQTKMAPVPFAVFSVFFRLYFIHSIINPFLYMKMDRHFRSRVKHLINSILCRTVS